MDQCKPFLMEVSGSTIPLDLIRIDLIEYEPIFYMNSFVKVTDINNSINYKTKLIDHGSYANVFKYRDEFYNRDIIIKRAKVNELNKKELERFKQEFEVMDKLNSPYVVSVYRYDDTKKEYFMECADETLKKYIDRNNTKIDNKKRFEIINQIIKALKYVHNKGYLHRDLSLSNVLLFHYDDVTVVKLSDFGLVKFEESDLTSINSDIKGSLNDPALIDDGFLNYSFEHEIYALTRLVLFVLTGKRNIQYLKDQRILDFVKNGTNPNKQLRFKDLDEFKKFVSKLII